MEILGFLEGEAAITRGVLDVIDGCFEAVVYLFDLCDQIVK